MWAITIWAITIYAGLENDATVFTHLFQPLGASSVRHGMTGPWRRRVRGLCAYGQVRMCVHRVCTHKLRMFLAAP